VRRHLGPLGDDGGVDIADAVAGSDHAARRFLQQRTRIGALELRVGVREVFADIAQRGRAQQGIGDRVQQHVGIGWPSRPRW
jgi:hypothetical protein